MAFGIAVALSAVSFQAAPPAAPYFYCQPWGAVREYITSSVDCRFALDAKGVPEFIEGLAWKACGERKVERWDASVSPPVPTCEKPVKRKRK